MERVYNNKIPINFYIRTPTDSVNVSNLELIDNLEKQPGYSTIYEIPFNPREFLLSKGYAKLKDTTKVIRSELEMQKKAQAARLGMWEKEVIPPDTSKPIPATQTIVLKAIDQKPVDWSFWIITITGFIGLSGFLAIKKYFSDKRLNLLIIGEISSGKTSLLNTLLDPSIKKSTILSIKKSDIIVTVNSDKTIQCGRYKIQPILTDVPGSQYDHLYEKIVGNITDRIFKRKSAIIFTLSPVKHNSQQEEIFDRDYKNVQLGILKACLGAISSNKPWKKPKVFLLFISKFDLISKAPLYDPASTADVKKIEEFFSEHIMLVKNELTKRKIPHEVIIGSSAEHWNTREVLTEICKHIYLRK
jgi:predicted GTPase